jgi:hypothetical protein
MKCYKLLIDKGGSIVSPYQFGYVWDLGKEMHYALGNEDVVCEDEELRDYFLLKDEVDCRYIKPRYCVSSGFIHSSSRPSFAAENAINFLDEAFSDRFTLLVAEFEIPEGDSFFIGRNGHEMASKRLKFIRVLSPEEVANDEDLCFLNPFSVKMIKQIFKNNPEG